jgi:hypothetical protein
MTVDNARPSAAPRVRKIGELTKAGFMMARGVSGESADGALHNSVRSDALMTWLFDLTFLSSPAGIGSRSTLPRWVQTRR